MMPREVFGPAVLLLCVVGFLGPVAFGVRIIIRRRVRLTRTHEVVGSDAIAIGLGVVVLAPLLFLIMVPLIHAAMPVHLGRW